MKKLISCVYYVLEVVTADRPCDRGAMLDEIGQYANFLKQPSTLGMFIPTDEQGNVLEKPSEKKPKGLGHIQAIAIWERQCKSYEEALSRVIFEGFKFFDMVKYDNTNGVFIVREGSKESIWIDSNGFNMVGINYKTIEDLLPLNLTLTPQTLK